MSDIPKLRKSRTDKTLVGPVPARLWTGTGMCPEAQGDGVPCHGTDGECEVCGRAIPRPAAAG